MARFSLKALLLTVTLLAAGLWLVRAAFQPNFETG
jgi:hypothetical protein